MLLTAESELNDLLKFVIPGPCHAAAIAEPIAWKAEQIRTVLYGTDRLHRALQSIANQQTSDEIQDDQSADWIGGYDAIINIARAALATNDE